MGKDVTIEGLERDLQHARAVLAQVQKYLKKARSTVEAQEERALTIPAWLFSLRWSGQYETKVGLSKVYRFAAEAFAKNGVRYWAVTGSRHTAPLTDRGLVQEFFAEDATPDGFRLKDAIGLRVTSKRWGPDYVGIDLRAVDLALEVQFYALVPKYGWVKSQRQWVSLGQEA